MKKYLILSLIGIAFASFALFANVNASVDDSGVYNYRQITSAHATTSPLLVKSGQGVLGSIVISSSTAGTLNIYDGTNMAVRTFSGATTSVATTTATTTVALFGASSANGTYTFDTAFTRGLTVMPSTNFVGSFTITWR